MRTWTTLIAADELRDLLGLPYLVTVDCRFSLQDPSAGRKAYEESHIPGAVYAHVDEDLSGPVIKGRTGRHPLPDVQILAGKLGAWGVGSGSQVVAYDDSGGSMAGRLWWLLKWLGHEGVAVLDGGWHSWVAAGGPTDPTVAVPHRRVFAPHLRPDFAVEASEVNRARADETWHLLDARTAERFRGENETIDPVAGHIPGAISMPFSENLDSSGRFRTPEELRARFGAAIGPVAVEHVVCYCGSGITAAHNVLAMAHAGMGYARLYPGSWSEWITDPARPVDR